MQRSLPRGLRRLRPIPLHTPWQRVASQRGLHMSPLCAASHPPPPPPPAGSETVFGRILQGEINKAAAGDAEVARAFARANRGDAAAAGNAEAGADAAASGASSASSSSGDGAVPRSRLTRLWDDALDVLCVAFGWERRRDVVAEYASGERAYPWVSYEEPGSGRRLFMNRESGVLTELQPPGWERFASAASQVTPDTESSALASVAAQSSAWERTLSAVSRAPLVAALVEAAGAAGAVVAASPVGQAAGRARVAVEDKVEEAREVWETSQHP